MKQFYCDDCMKIYRKQVYKCECGSKEIKPIVINTDKQTIREY